MALPPQLPNRALFEQQFTPTGLLQLAEDLFREIGSREDGAHALKFKTGITKKLIEEIHPLALLTTRIYAPTDEVLIRPNLDNQAFDAEILVDNCVQRVETTYAIHGQQKRLQMEHLEQMDFAPVASNVRATGNKHNRVFERSRIFTGRPSNDPREALGLIHTAMLAKSAHGYPADYWMLITFEDPNMRSEAAITRIRDYFLDLVQVLFPNQARVFLLGIHGHVFVDSREFSNRSLAPIQQWT